MLGEMADDRAGFQCPRVESLRRIRADHTCQRRKTVVLHRDMKNWHLAAVGPIWALAALCHSRGARADATVCAAGDWNRQAG